MGTIGASIAFYKLCKPFRDFLQFPKEVKSQLEDLKEKVDGRFESLDQKVDDHFEQSNKRMDKFTEDLQGLKNDLERQRLRAETNDKGTEALLRDRILQAHRYLMGREFITQDEYESVTAMFQSYKDLGGNHFVDRLMQDIDKKKIEVVDTGGFQ